MTSVARLNDYTRAITTLGHRACAAGATIWACCCASADKAASFVRNDVPGLAGANVSPSLQRPQPAVSSPSPANGNQDTWLQRQRARLSGQVVTLSGWLVAFVSMVITSIALLPSFRSEDLSRKSLELAQWTAMKDYVEQCREELLTIKSVSSDCQEALSTALPPPPHYHQGSTMSVRQLMARNPVYLSSSGSLSRCALSHSHAVIIAVAILAVLLISILFFASCETGGEKLHCQRCVIGLDDWEAIGTSSGTLSLLSSVLSELGGDSEHVMGRERLLELLASLRVPQNRQDHEPQPQPAVDISSTSNSTAESSSADVRPILDQPPARSRRRQRQTSGKSAMGTNLNRADQAAFEDCLSIDESNVRLYIVEIIYHTEPQRTSSTCLRSKSKDGSRLLLYIPATEKHICQDGIAFKVGNRHEVANIPWEHHPASSQALIEITQSSKPVWECSMPEFERWIIRQICEIEDYGKMKLSLFVFLKLLDQIRKQLASQDPGASDGHYHAD